jgi:hypothetical protein
VTPEAERSFCRTFEAVLREQTGLNWKVTRKAPARRQADQSRKKRRS